MASLVIAVDGPSGSGKSSVSKGVARRFGLQYLDTGAMYRAVTWWALQESLEPSALPGRLAECTIEVGTEPDHPAIAVNGTDVSGPIRTPEVTGSVSAVSAIPEVRRAMVVLQRRIAAEAPVGLVAEGRDMGTVVFPDAPVKFFLDADVAARAQRRQAEDSARGQSADVAQTRAGLAARDAADSGRAVSPLLPADDAIRVDATHMGLQEVIDTVCSLIEERLR